MKIQYLNYFITLSESRSINEAAKRLYISQPNLTTAIQSLEKELGFPLFRRTKTGSVLTAAGRKILPEAKQMVEIYNRWLAMGSHDLPQEITIHTHISLSSFIIPNILLHFGSSYPELPVRYELTMWPEKCYSMDIRRPSLGLAICTEDEMFHTAVKKWNCQPILLFQGEYGCLVHSTGELAEKEYMTEQDLQDYFFISPDLGGVEQLEGDSIAAPCLQKIFQVAASKNMVQVQTVGNVLALLERAPNAFVLSCSPAHNRYGGVKSGLLKYIPIKDMVTKVNVYLFYSEAAQHHYPVVNELIETIQQSCRLFLEDSAP